MQVLNQLVGHQIVTPEAAAVLGLSERHAWRMLVQDRGWAVAASAYLSGSRLSSRAGRRLEGV